MNGIVRRGVIAAAMLCVGASPAWQPSTNDMVALKHLALNNGAPVHYIAKSPSEMPAFDPDVFYAGDVDPGWIWQNRGEYNLPYHNRNQNNALILAAMDMGAAGERWKAFYDDLRREDEAQPAPVKDPYHYRHAFLKTLDARLAALAPHISAPPPDPSIDAEADTITKDDLAHIMRGIFAPPIQPKDATENDASVFKRNPLVDEYEFYTDREPPGSEDESMGAYFDAVVAGGAAGEALKQRYQAASDKNRFGIVLARAFDLENERTEKNSRAQIAWIKENVRPGMRLADVEPLLRTHNLRLIVQHSIANIELPIHSTIACGTSIAVTITFDAETVKSVEEQPPYTACL